MARLALAALALLVCLAAAKNAPTFPTWPSSYSASMVSETSDSPPTETTLYIDATNHRSRFDVPSAQGTVTELIFSPPNPGVRASLSSLAPRASTSPTNAFEACAVFRCAFLLLTSPLRAHHLLHHHSHGVREADHLPAHSGTACAARPHLAPAELHQLHLRRYASHDSHRARQPSAHRLIFCLCWSLTVPFNVGKTSAHNESCDTWDMVCHSSTNSITTTYLWFGARPLRSPPTSVCMHTETHEY